MRPVTAAVHAEPPILAPSLRASIGLHVAAAALAIVEPPAWPWALTGLAANHAVLTAAGMWPQSSLLGPNLRRLPATGRAEAAITFDDGPDPEVTPRVLDLLDRHRARATFFCIGARARAHPDLVREIARRGHAVENHSDNHLNCFAALAPDRLGREIAAAQATLAELADTAPVFFRAPMGLRSPFLQPILAGQRLRLASWTRRALDGAFGDAGAAWRRLRRGLAAGDVLLLHDGRAARTGSGQAVVLSILPGLLELMAERGLNCVTLRDGSAP